MNAVATLTEIDRAVDSLAQKQSDIREIRLDDVHVDKRFQRALNDKKVRDIMAAYHPSGLGLILVARIRNNGGVASGPYAVIDGQTRLTALQRLREEAENGRTNVAVPDVVRAEVFPDLTTAEAAQLFRLRNAQMPVRPWDRDRIAVVAGDAVMQTVLEQANAAGYRIFMDDAETPSDMSALTEAKRIVAWGKRWGRPDLLTEALSIQAQAFRPADLGDDIPDTSVDRFILAATADLLRRNENLNEDDLVRCMAEIGKESILSLAQQQKNTNAVRMMKAVKIVLVSRYNKGKTRGADKIHV